jgi:hypothetical protein
MQLQVPCSSMGRPEFVVVFFGIRFGRVGAAEEESVLVTRDDGIDRRILPGADTVEPEFVALVDERHTHLGCEERGRNLRVICAQTTGQSNRKVTAFMATYC